MRITFSFSRGVFLTRLLAPLLALLLASCKTGEGSKEEAIASNDWFKDGVDRFYLAYVKSDVKMLPRGPETYGQQFFFGIGCYNEPTDPNTLIMVRKTPYSPELVKKRLIDREMLHEFDLISSEQKPKPGQCKILLGDENEAIQISKLKSFKGGSKSGLGLVFVTSGLVCIGSVAQTAKFIAEVIAGAGATGASVGAAGAVILPPLFLEGAGAVASIIGCGGAVKGTLDTANGYIDEENKKVFSQAIVKAIAAANHELKSNSVQYERYSSLRRNLYNVEVAAAIWNPLLVRKFNRVVQGYFENGWGKSERFFDSVKQIQTETLITSTTVKE